MRHQAYPAVHPDGFYGVHDDVPYTAKTSTADKSLLLVAEEGQQPDGFDKEYEGRAAAVFAASEVPRSFTIHTRCEYADETFALVEQSDDGSEVTLAWTGTDEEIAEQLGLERTEGGAGFSLTTPIDKVEAVWQELHDYIDLDNYQPTDAGDPSDLLRQIGMILNDLRAEDADGIAAQYRQVGDYAELEVRYVTEDVSYSVASPPALGYQFSELRRAMYHPAAGTWYTGTFTLDADGNFDFHHDGHSQPQWRLAPDADDRHTGAAFAVELQRYPRREAPIPPWLGARAGLPLDVDFRQARVVDEHQPGERPVADRPPVPPPELRGVLDYLYKSPVVLVGGEPLADFFAPQTAPSVPNAFHTDGEWIWPAAVPHYLRMHGIAPEPDLVQHIRDNHYRPPFVSERLRETAKARIEGKPYPPQSPEDLDERDPVTDVERDDTLQPRLRASDVLILLRKRLDELGISRDVYAFGTSIEDGWALERVENDWQVARYVDGEQRSADVFDHVSSAAAHLLGLLAFYPTRAMAEPDPAEAATDWPVQPLRGEPPLTLFRGKRMVVLPADTVVVRYGPDGGNLVHQDSVRFRETSLTADRATQRREFRVTRPLRVLTGVTLPFGGMPGGALAYFLPGPVGLHLRSRALVPVAPRAAAPPAQAATPSAPTPAAPTPDNGAPAAASPAPEAPSNA